MISKLVMTGLLFMLLLCSCGADVPGYIGYVEDTGNGLHVVEKVSPYELGAQFKPIDYVLVKERHILPSDGSKWESAKEDVEGLQYFTFHLKRVDGKSVTASKGGANDSLIDIVTYFSFDLERDFYLLDGKDSLPCVLFNWPRQFDLSPNESFMLAFPKAKEGGAKTLVYNDKVLGIGTRRFEIKEESINSIPEIK